MADQEQFQNIGPQDTPSQNINLRPEAEKSSVKLPVGLQAGIGLAVASLVLGLVSLPLSLFVIGAGAGLIGLILAIIHLRKRLPLKAIATWGLVLSAMGLIAGTGFGVFYGFSIYKSFSMMQGLADTQFEQYIGTPAPDLTLTDLEGNEIILSSLKGKPVILDFWATWCPPCKKEIPHFIELRKTIKPEELAIIGISNEPAEIIKPFAEKNNINYTLVSMLDDELPEPFNNIISIPTTFFIDDQGVIQNVLTGYHSFKELKDNAFGKTKKLFESELNIAGDS